ncbi:hypothetical protein KK083_31405 [Fulvivirgaceae bacterium PWU4]|uniref:Uncharacterized protein n=1 Tax=Chryseosolibacter histidini TaxID=2782349 RepID=A0AAP2DU96_9BACT|nr:hypothetical protein [Chryseosolibacter histidini]MBT1701443.1 hypothetical protein [Chryseosolibacter histidini]
MEKIEMLGSPQKRGPLIHRKEYEKITEYILAQIKKNGESISLNELLDNATNDLGDIALVVLQVKRDLEARGVIETALNNKREQFLLIKKRQKKRSTVRRMDY